MGSSPSAGPISVPDFYSDMTDKYYYAGCHSISPVRVAPSVDHSTLSVPVFDWL